MKAFVTALVVLVLALSTATGLNHPGIRLTLRKNENYMKPWTGPEPPEPLQHDEKVHRCWGYLGRPKPIADLRAFFRNGTYPSTNTCQGVVNVHQHCWPHMFLLWDFARPVKRIFNLRRHCRGRILPHRLPLP